MNILLTGSSGFLGHYLKTVLVDEGNLITLGASSNNNLIFDLSEGEPDLPHSFDFIVHAAGKAHFVPRSADEKKLFYDVNFLGTVNLIKAIENLEQLPSQIVYISTVAVYGYDEGCLLDEDTLCIAHDAYGESKLLAENFLKKWGEEKDVIITILRLPLIAGKNAPGNLEDMIKAVKNGRFALIGDGGAKRSVVLAEDVAKFIPEIQGVGGVYNLTDGQHPSFKNLSDIITIFYKQRNVKRIPLLLAEILAFICEVVKWLIGKDILFGKRRLKKMTSSLTFNDQRARKQGWKPRKVIENYKCWL